MRTFVKICGLTDADAVSAASESGADAVGFVFADSVRRISIEAANALAARVPKKIRKVAVMLHPSNEEWEAVMTGFRPDVLQTDLADFDYLDVPDDIERWPVLREGTLPASGDLPDTFVYEGRISGSAETVDWSVAAELAKRGGMILAGGLDIANVSRAIAEVGPFGVDVSSGVESAPGRKDTDKIRHFIDAVRRTAPAGEEKRA